MIPFRHKWEIANVKTLFEDSISGHPTLFSSKFSPIDNDHYELKLRLDPLGRNEESKNDLFTYLILGSSLVSKVAVQFKFSIIDCRGRLFNTKGWHQTLTKKEFWLNEAYISRDQILNTENGLLKNNKLTLLCEGEIIVDGYKLSKNELFKHYEIFRDKTFNSKISTTSSQFDVHLNKLQVAHKWTLDNMINLQLTGTPSIYSSKFSPKNRWDHQIKLNMSQNKDYISFYAFLTSRGKYEVIMQHKFTLLDCDGEICKTAAWQNTFKKGNNVYGHSFLRDSLLSSNKEGVLKNDKITLLWEGEILEDGCKLSEESLSNCLSIFEHTKISNTEPTSSSYFNALMQQTIPFSYKWIIDNFSTLCTNTEKDKFIKSPVFSPPNHTEYQFALRMYPESDDSRDYIGLYLGFVPNLIHKVTVQHKLSIIDCESKKCNTKGNTSELEKNIPFRGYANYASRESLLSSNSGLLKNDKLTILCEGQIILNADKLSQLDRNNLYQIFWYKHADLPQETEESPNIEGAQTISDSTEPQTEIDENVTENTLRIENEIFLIDDDETLAKMHSLLSKLIKNNLLNVETKNETSTNIDFAEATLENVIFSCNSSNTMKDFIVNNKENFGIKDDEKEFFIQNIDKMIKENFQNLLPVLRELPPVNSIFVNEVVKQGQISKTINPAKVEKPKIIFDNSSAMILTTDNESVMNIDMLSDFKTILSKMIENNLLKIQLNNSSESSGESKIDFGTATLKDVTFSCKSELEISNIIQSEAISNIYQFDNKKFLDNIDQLIKSNFEQLTPLFKKCIQLRFIIKDRKYVTTPVSSITNQSKSKHDILSDAPLSKTLDTKNVAEEHFRKIDDII